MKNDFKQVPVAGDRMADFSSRGPNSDGNYGIKPDLSAPGVQIFSSCRPTERRIRCQLRQSLCQAERHEHGDAACGRSCAAD